MKSIYDIKLGEHVAIVGPNAAGKSMMLDRLVGRDIKYITFRDSYGAYDRTYYLQQRWNSTEIDVDMPTVGKVLRTPTTLFGIDKLWDKELVLLSSGEMRKFQLVKLLQTDTGYLIIDNPYIGLDRETRTELNELLGELARKGNLRIVLVLTKPEEVPEFITEVWNMEGPQNAASEDYLEELKKLPQKDSDYNTELVAQMRKVKIQYGNRIILNELDWTVRNGECWALNGRNGSGKSTLLSLICADNPQSYACDITLFDRKRGSGETIWDIKKHIGYVSPELHRAYQRDLPTIQIIASGLNDSVGLNVKVTEQELQACRFWMRIFGIEGLEERSFMKLSSGEQRLVLLARAFVKDPELLILDEPLHGLDNKNGERVKKIIDTFCSRPNKTLIMVSHYREEYPRCITKEYTL